MLLPGVGKTHLAIALGVKAVEAGHSVLFLTLERLMGRLVRTRHENRLDRTLQQVAYPRVLILHELGHLPLTREEASLFFRLPVRRYERASLIVTSNKSFVDWGEVFNDQILATATLDRLLHYATTANIQGGSYRLREKKKAGLPRRPPSSKRRRWEPKRKPGDPKVGEQRTSYFGVFGTTSVGLDNSYRRQGPPGGPGVASQSDGCSNRLVGYYRVL